MSVERLDVDQTAGCSETDALLSDRDQGTCTKTLFAQIRRHNSYCKINY